MFKITGFFTFILLIFSPLILAENISISVTEKVETGVFPVGVGSHVILKTEDKKLNGNAIFVGNSIYPDGSNSYQIYLNIKSKKVFYIAPEQFTRLPSNRHQKILDSYEQAGGTCSAYAIHNFLQQTSLSRFQGTGELDKLISTEEGRTFLLADAINEYYLTLSHQYSLKGIMNKYGKKFGFTCKKLQTDSFEKVSDFILSQVQFGLPVMISFNIGPKMVNGPFKLEAYEQKGVKFDERLWIPRRVGERNNGGHSIVALAAFTAFNKTYLVMLDSDWSEPRLWDMNEFLNHEKTALKEIEFITCK